MYTDIFCILERVVSCIGIQAFQKLSEIFTPFCAEIDKMALIKWEEDNPYQELAVYDLK